MLEALFFPSSVHTFCLSHLVQFIFNTFSIDTLLSYPFRLLQANNAIYNSYTIITSKVRAATLYSLYLLYALLINQSRFISSYHCTCLYRSCNTCACDAHGCMCLGTYSAKHTHAVVNLCEHITSLNCFQLRSKQKISENV
jgi:hypothetical protein